MARPEYREALRRTGIITALAAFDPRVAGTPPLGLDLPASDIDVLCHAPNPNRFAAVVWSAFSGEANFTIRRWVAADRPVIASFTAHGWRFELFGQAKPVSEQNGWRHFIVERRLLAFGGPAFRAAIFRARTQGMKTEPAFAAVLRLPGDPYQAVVELERRDDASLMQLLTAAGFVIE
jgi:hypothetical protein